MPNSLFPKLLAVVTDRTFLGWFFWLLRWLLASCVLPGCYAVFLWVSTRYDTTSAQALTGRVGALEKEVGLRQDDLSCASSEPTVNRDTSLEDRVLVIEQWKRCREDRLTLQFIAVERRMVSIAAASAETRPALRAAAAREAVKEFEAVLARQKTPDPEAAAAAVLETRPPR